MIAIFKREIRNYLKRPLFWVGVLLVIYGVFNATSPYLTTHYLTTGEKIINDQSNTSVEGEVYEGYIPATPEKHREVWHEKVKIKLTDVFGLTDSEAQNVIEKLESRLKELEKRRGETRRARQKNGVPVISLVGYTNVGKSSLTNALCGAEIFEADMLFATLDPTARKCTLPSGLQVILVDTVGFVSRLPHDLVDAFKSTLEEAACSDIILKIADASDSEAAEQLSVTDEVLNDLGCGDIPQVTVYNKCDRTGVAPYDPDVLLVSAKTGYGLDSLLAKIDEILAHRVRTIEVLLPYDKLALADVFRTRGSVLAEEYRENGVYYKATVKVDDLHRFEAYLL